MVLSMRLIKICQEFHMHLLWLCNAHPHYPYSRPSMFNQYPENVYSEYEHQQKSSLESQHEAQRQTSHYPGYVPGDYPQSSRMNIEIVPPQRHMQATPIQRVSSESIVDRQQAEVFPQHHSMETHFSTHECHMQGRHGIDQFSESQYHQPQRSHYQASGMETSYPPTPQPQSPGTEPFRNTAEMPSFGSLSNVDNSQVHLSGPTTPVTDPLYSDNSVTPDQKPMETDTPEVC